MLTFANLKSKFFRMRRLIILIVLLANALMALAQNGVKGRVVEADGTPVMYAAVVLEAGGKTAAGAMTGEDGTFLMNGVFTGQYILRISSIGCPGLSARSPDARSSTISTIC